MKLQLLKNKLFKVKYRLERNHWIWQSGDFSETKFFQVVKVVIREQCVEDKISNDGNPRILETTELPGAGGGLNHSFSFVDSTACTTVEFLVVVSEQTPNHNFHIQRKA